MKPAQPVTRARLFSFIEVPPSVTQWGVPLPGAPSRSGRMLPLRQLAERAPPTLRRPTPVATSARPAAATTRTSRPVNGRLPSSGAAVSVAAGAELVEALGFEPLSIVVCTLPPGVP